MANGNPQFSRVTNTSRQMIPIQVRRPQGDFYLEERQVMIGAGKSVILPTEYLMPAQIENLAAKQQLQVTSAN